MFWSGSVGLSIQVVSLPSSGTDVKLTLWIRPHGFFWRETLFVVLDGAIRRSPQRWCRPRPMLGPCPRKMNIPTVIFINKIDQAGWFADAVQSVTISFRRYYHQADGVAVPGNSPEENTDIEAWDVVIENNDELLESISGEPISRENLARGRNSSGSKTPPVPSLSWQSQMALAFNRWWMWVTG